MICKRCGRAVLELTLQKIYVSIKNNLIAIKICTQCHTQFHSDFPNYNHAIGITHEQFIDFVLNKIEEKVILT